MRGWKNSQKKLKDIKCRKIKNQKKRKEQRKRKRQKNKKSKKNKKRKFFWEKGWKNEKKRVNIKVF